MGWPGLRRKFQTGGQFFARPCRGTCLIETERRREVGWQKKRRCPQRNQLALTAKTPERNEIFFRAILGGRRKKLALTMVRLFEADSKKRTSGEIEIHYIAIG